MDSKIVGKHEGLMYYTIGQRKGLEIGGNNHFEYDYNGLRIKKITSNEEIEYTRDGKIVLKESYITYNTSIIEGKNQNNMIIEDWLV